LIDNATRLDRHGLGARIKGAHALAALRDAIEPAPGRFARRVALDAVTTMTLTQLRLPMQLERELDAQQHARVVARMITVPRHAKLVTARAPNPSAAYRRYRSPPRC
jgi:hypothetical protein